MQPIADDIKKLFSSFSNAEINRIEKLPQSGGDRVYFRLITDDGSYIATYNENIKENQTFLNFTRHFKKTIVLFLKFIQLLKIKKFISNRILEMNLY